MVMRGGRRGKARAELNAGRAHFKPGGNRRAATDAAGNVSAASPYYTVTVDTTITAGTLSLLNYTDSGTSSSDFNSTDKSFDLSLTGTESGASVVYQLSTDGGGSWSTTTSTQSNLTDGAYQLRAAVSDAAGNTANTNDYCWCTCSR